MKSGLYLQLAFLLTISGIAPTLAVEPARPDTTAKTGRNQSPHADLFRLGGGAAGSTRSSNARTNEQVRSHRSAHAKARLDHTINRLHALGLKSPGGHITSPAKATFQARLTDMSSVQHLVITAGHDTGKAHNGEGQGSSGTSDDSHNQIASNHNETPHDETHSQGSRTERDHEHSEKLKRENRRKEREPKGFSHRLKHPDGDASGGDGGQGASQGIGDGSSVGLNTPDEIDELHDQMRNITLHQGTAFVAHNKPVVLNTDHGEVRIAPHSAVYVIALDKSVGVYDIADHKTSDVVIVTHGKKQIAVKAGEQVLLTDKKENKEFEKANPAPEIHSTRMKELASEGEEHTKIFHAEFSPLAALDHAEGFHDLVNSKSKADRALANHILKTAAVVLHLRSSD